MFIFISSFKNVLETVKGQKISEAYYLALISSKKQKILFLILS